MGLRVNIPKSFATDLDKTYHGQLSIDRLIVKHEQFLRGLAKHALRYRTQFMISDEDDLFQEACFWLLNSIWEYDEERSASLVRYVIYNIGVRLATLVKYEKNIKRHPEPNTSRSVDLWGTKDDSQTTVESTIPGSTSVELEVAIRECIEHAEIKLSRVACQLTRALIECNGNLTGACQLLLQQDDIVKQYGTDLSHLKYRMRYKVLPEIMESFSLEILAV